jgi:hypothetical protein
MRRFYFVFLCELSELSGEMDLNPPFYTLFRADAKVDPLIVIRYNHAGNDFSR